MRASCIPSFRTAAMLFCGAILFGPSYAQEKPVKAVPLNPEQKIRHTLDRIGFGPRPGDVERVRRMGLDRYIDQQLHPETISDTRVEAGLQTLSTLSMSSSDLAGRYRVATQRVIQQVAVKASPDPPAAPGEAERALETRRKAQQESRAFLGLVARELQTAKVVRAVESDRQLQEVMVDFWTNHFNIDVRKGPARALKSVDDREVVRTYALGRFRDLLGASARSPAMLVYLDNARSSAPMPARRNVRGGLNENYARELMELHTLGVDGGYTQKDVVEVARCFTGWTLNPRTGAFFFAPRRHDNGEKVVLGNSIPSGGGMRDGERVLDILAAHPATARHISYELCQRFVSDRPPVSLVERAAKIFRQTDGDIRAVVRTILTSREFNAPGAYRAKMKSPFEYAVSAIRALDGHMAPGARNAARGRSVVAQVAAMGEPLFQCQAPTGYSEDSTHWVSAGSLVARLNFALALSNGQVSGVRLPAEPTMSSDLTPEAMLKTLETRILGGPATPATHGAILRQVKESAPGTGPDMATLTALVLGAPEFQKR